MSFAWPAALLALLLVPAALGVYLYAERRRRQEAGAFGNPLLLPRLAHSPSGLRRRLPVILALAALAALAVGLARPHATVSTTREEATVVLAIDVSRSMAANDVRPSRLAAARVAARTFLDYAPESYRIGIVSFSTQASVVLPPTTNRDAGRAALEQLRLGAGTAIGDAIVRSLRVAVPPAEQSRAGTGTQSPASIVLLSDGAQTTGSPMPRQAAEQARRAGVPVSTVALGTRGATVRVPQAGGPTQLVTVPPDPKTLEQVARITGGQAFRTADAAALEKVYRDLSTRLVEEDESEEVTALFAGGGAVLLLVGGALSTLWFRRAL